MYVDDLKISHVDPGVIDEVKAGPVKRYQTLTEKTGPKFDMEMDYSTPGEVSVTMDSCPHSCQLSESTSDIHNVVTCTVTNQMLFEDEQEWKFADDNQQGATKFERSNTKKFGKKEDPRRNAIKAALGYVRHG